MSQNKNKHGHKNCRKLLGSLSDYVDGELSEELCSVIDTHMKDCEDCRIVVNTLRKTVDIYHMTSEDENLPGDIKERLFKTLDIEAYLG
jgi:predicted anti-sigma-YlaC factor YlaD